MCMYMFCHPKAIVELLNRNLSYYSVTQQIHKLKTLFFLSCRCAILYLKPEKKVTVSDMRCPPDRDYFIQH